MTGGRSWTDEQWRAIERRDGDLLLDAAAGSGKTSVLVERFALAVIEDGIDVARILAITFTEKAAAELRDRIRGRLRELGAVEHARATEGAFISTIHGFCARVLRTSALAAGLDPGFVVLDREQSDPLAQEAFDDALRDIAPADGAVDLIADYSPGRLRDTVLAVHAQLRSRGERVPRLPPCPPGVDRGAAAQTLQRSLEEVGAELAAVADPGPRVLDALDRLARCRALLGVDDLWPAELGWVKLPANGAALGTDACGAYSEALAAYQAVCAARAAGPVRDHLDALLAAFDVRYGERKRAISGVDFEDLELLTLALLRGNGALRERYAQRFERIMVDELQDTNRVQLELIEAIARGNLFTVGDAQQSIYRFRHADVRLFQRRAERLAAAGELQTLQVNFRSRPEVLNAINAAFANELEDQFKALIPSRDPTDGDAAAGPRVELILADKGADWELEGLAAPWRLAEAAALADRVGELVGAGTAPGKIVVLIRATTDMRAYERALERRGLPTYVIGGRGYWLHPQVLDLVAYLRTLANPRDEQALYTVLSSPLVGASLDALVVLAGDARASGGDPWSLLLASGGVLDAVDSDDRRVLAEFVGWFARERTQIARTRLEDLIDGVLRRTGYDLAMLAMPGGRRRLANVRKLMRLAREYERDHGPNLRGFVDAVAEREQGGGGGAHESEAPVEGEGLDAIRLMTIHRAKGLEFDTVCVADLGRSVRPPYELVRVGSDGRLGLRLQRSGARGRVSALDYNALGEEGKLAEEREERRLFYVAMTRARERLVLSGATRFQGWTEGGATGGGPAAWIAPAFVAELGERIAEGGGDVALGDSWVRLRVVAPGDSPGGVEGPDGEAAPAPAATFPDAPAVAAPAGAALVAPTPAHAVPGPPVTTLSYSALGAYARCSYRFYCERVLGLPAAPEPVDEQAPGPDRVRPATERGVILHALLERLSFRAPAAPSAEAIGAAAAAAGLRAPTTDEAAELTAVVARFVDSPLCERLGRATELRREEPFAFELVAPILVNGVIDVLAREPGGRALVVDYKSDRLDGGDPALLVDGPYATQRLVYALAALRGGAAAVEVAYCFLEQPDRPVTATFERSQRDDLDQRLRRLADGVLRREFEVSPAPHRGLCAGCPAEGGLCSWPLESTRRESADRLF